MPFTTIALSYVSSLIANAVVLLGCVSLFMWIERETDTPVIVRHRQLFLCLLGIGLLLLAYLEAQANNVMSTHLTGFHWTYLNLVIVALYNLMLRIKIPAQMIISLVFTIFWGLNSLITGGASSKTVIQTGALLLVEVIICLFAKQIESHWWSYGVGFIVFSWVALQMGSMLYVGQTPGAWTRQIVALIVLEAVVVGYADILRYQDTKLKDFKHQAEFDALTGAATFGVFNTHLQELYGNFRQTGETYAMFAMDVDHFKRINDTYGHVAGNEVLRTIAHTINEVVKEFKFTGRLYRTGGEEFTIIIENIKSDPEMAETISRSIQRGISELRFTFKGEAVSVTISIGEERVSPSDANYLDIYKRADQYLYASKHNGRNAITLRGRTLDQGTG